MGAREEPGDVRGAVVRPAALVRVADMLGRVEEELARSPASDSVHDRVLELYGAALEEAEQALSGELVAELVRLHAPDGRADLTMDEIRISIGQLHGWIDGTLEAAMCGLEPIGTDEAPA